MMKNEPALQFTAAKSEPFRLRGGDGEAAELVECYRPLVRKLARQLHRRGGATEDLEDLIQLGMMTLIEASRTYVDQGHAFATYAAIRVRGAMVDHLRREMASSRGGATAARKLEAARHDFEQQHCRAPSSKELALAANIAPQDFVRFEMMATLRRAVPIDEPSQQMLVDPDVIAADALAEYVDEIRFLGRAVAQLSEREQLVLQLYFHESLNLHDIGTAMGVSAARVCQIKSGALHKLHQIMARATAA